MPEPTPPSAPASVPEAAPPRHADLLGAAFVCVLVCSAVIGAGKVAVVGGFSFGAGILFFPLSYLFNDVLTEVYGYARSRRIVWAGFAGLAFASLMSAVVVALPPSPAWPHQGAYEIAFGTNWRIAGASLLGFFGGEFVNAYVLARMKVASEGRNLWGRLVGSTVAGEAVDTLVFYPLAFGGLWSWPLLLSVMAANYALKVGWEAIAAPATGAFIGWLKRVEGVDVYDRDTNFSPFRL